MLIGPLCSEGKTLVDTGIFTHFARLSVAHIDGCVPGPTARFAVMMVKRETGEQMNAGLPLTRRDVVALVIYVVLAYNVVSPLVTLASRFVLERVPGIQKLPTSGRLLESAVNLGIAFVFSFALMPFVSLIAGGATGRKAFEVVTRQSIRPLVFTCAGIMLLLMSLPQFCLIIGYYFLASNLYGRSAPVVRPFLLQSITSTLVVLSLGFALAFFPSIFGALRARVQDEEFVA